MGGMPKAISDVGKAVGLAIYNFGLNKEKFTSGEIRQQIPDLSAQSTNNRLRHFKDLGYIETIAYGVYKVPEDKVDPLWDYLTTTGAIKKTSFTRVPLSEGYTIKELGRDDRVIEALAITACYEGDPYKEVLTKFLETHVNLLLTVIDDIRRDNFTIAPKSINSPGHIKAKELLEKWMQ